ncbi:hypothetical protein MBLNU13_g09060t1 [Cladosporium sp. NU13]
MAAFRPEHELEPVDVLFIEVADSCLEVEMPQPDSTEAESELLSLKISQAFSFHKDRSSAHFSAVLTKQLLLPFIDVLCVFAEDVGGCDGVLQHLKYWALANIEGTETQVPTRLVVVLSPSDVAEQAKQESTRFAESFYAFGLGQLFPNIRVETTSSLPLRNARYIPLRDIVLGPVLEAALEARTERMHLFSGLHLASLFSQRLAQTAKHPRRSFCPLLASRQGIPALSHFVECLHL